MIYRSESLHIDLKQDIFKKNEQIILSNWNDVLLGFAIDVENKCMENQTALDIFLSTSWNPHPQMQPIIRLFPFLTWLTQSSLDKTYTITFRLNVNWTIMVGIIQ